MSDREIDEILRQSAQALPPVDPAQLDRIVKSIGSSIRPVRSIRPAWVLACGLFLTCASVAIAGAMRSGLYGIHNLSVLERALIFPALAVFIWVAAAACVSEIVPGSRRRVSPWTLLIGGCLALLAVFATLFRDYQTDHFLSQGVICLAAGLLHAIPVALVSWLMLRRGYAVNPMTAGLALGTLGALGGVTMLELHCANLQAWHIMIWHTAVIPIAAATGAWLGIRFPRKR